VVTVIAKEDAASDVRCEFEYSQKSLNCFRWSSELEREREREKEVLCSLQLSFLTILLFSCVCYTLSFKFFLQHSYVYLPACRCFAHQSLS